MGLEVTAGLSIMLASTLPQETAALSAGQMPPSEGPVAAHKLVPVSLLLEFSLCVNHFYIRYKSSADGLVSWGFADP